MPAVRIEYEGNVTELRCLQERNPERHQLSAATSTMANYATPAALSQPEAANILFASELTCRRPGITSVSCHLGIIET